MENLAENDKKTKSRGDKRFTSQIKSSISSAIKEIKSDKQSLIQDLLIFTMGFLLSRCPLILGARPLGISLIALMQNGIWPALLGSVIGSLSQGSDGIILAVATVVTALLRVVTSISERRSVREGELFGESLLLRLSVSVLGGFIVAVYEALMRGLSEATLIFGLSMIILTPILTFLLSGLCSTGIKFDELIWGSSDLFRLSGLEKNERYDKIFFQISALSLILFISLSFKSVNIFGISLSYVFAVIISLLVAKRFGALRGMATGFFASVAISGELSVAFALVGLCSGVMIGFGVGYAIVAGGVALCVWSAYSSGLTGLLSTLPEYLIGVAISLPMLREVNVITSDDTTEAPSESAEDMVGTMALAYQREYSGCIDNLENALTSISQVIGRYAATPIGLSREEYRVTIIEVAEGCCKRCIEKGLCSKENIRPVIKNINHICDRLCDGKKVCPEDINSGVDFCPMAGDIAEKINREIGRKEQESYQLSGSGGAADEYEIISHLIGMARAFDEAEKTVDISMNETLSAAVQKCGLNNGFIRVFGNRRRHFILAGEDDGRIVSSFEMRKGIEEAAGVKLGAPEYYKKGSMVLMKCGIRPAYKVSFATVSEAGSRLEISGDSAVCFETKEDYFYSLISDGMGSGELAKETSEFAVKFIREAMEIGTANEILLHMLNHSIRTRREECSATIDLFELDLLHGNAVFLKSGASPSYVKRNSSIFRIRSQTAPIGLMRSIDTEKISVEIKGGDYIFMMSDGIVEIAEDAAWLLLLLAEPPKENLEEYARLILREAKANGVSGDDMTVTVIRVDEV